MIFFILICFIQQGSYSVTEIEKLYLNSYNFTNDSIKNYKQYPEYSELIQLFSRQNNFKSKRFKQWIELRNSAVKVSPKFGQISSTFSREYHEDDRYKIIRYYTILYNIWSSEYNNFSELIHVLGKETELDKLLERNVFYSYLLWLESTNVFSIDYFKALVKSIEIDIQLKNDHNLYYDLFYNTFFALRKNYFNTFLIPLLNNKRLERFEKTIPYIEADKNTFTIWLMEAYLFQKNSYYIKKIAKTLNPNYLSEEYKIASTYLIYPDSVLKREVFLDKKELRTQQFLNENRIFNLSLKDKNINDIQKSYYELQKFRGDDNNEFKNSLDMIELNYNVFFDTGKADSIYAKIKEAHFQKQIAELSYNSSNKLDIYSSSLSNYLLKKSKEDLEFAINEYLLLNGFKSFYQKKIQPELLKDEKYTSLLTV